MDIILLRHGESQDNLLKRYSSDDTPLSEEGILQIERAATQLNNMIIDRVLVSPLTRAVQTYEIIKKYHDYPSDIYEDIRELDPGYGQGLTFEQVSKEYPEEMDRYMKDYINAPMPGGESVIDGYNRAGRVLDRLKNSSGSALLVTHQAFISLMIANILGDPKMYQYFRVANGSFTLIRMEPHFHIEYINRI